MCSEADDDYHDDDDDQKENPDICCPFQNMVAKTLKICYNHLIWMIDFFFFVNEDKFGFLGHGDSKRPKTSKMLENTYVCSKMFENYYKLLSFSNHDYLNHGCFYFKRIISLIASLE